MLLRLRDSIAHSRRLIEESRQLIEQSRRKPKDDAKD